VAVGVVQPAMLDRLPITPELLAGRWERVYTSAPVSRENKGSSIFHKDGSYVSEVTDRRTGKLKA